jgi:hypothetical protein
MILLSLLVIAVPALAGEGMWRPGQLPQLADHLRQTGLEIAPERLSDLTSHPMNAVISLGGCTASFVSPEGLTITNYHCAKGAIQYNSTEERNLLESGFLAKERSEEVGAGPGSRVLVTVAVTDVTDKVVGGLGSGLTGAERYRAIETHEKELVAKCEEDDGHRCRVRAYHGGLEYELIKQLEIRDVRLVYAPAAMIGEYGGEVDNWMWPRHTGDYSFYRAYVGPDGKPADPAEENVPFRPKHFLKIATDPLQAGDFAMVAGYPGTTNRYRLASEIEETFAWSYPVRKQVYEEWRAIIAEATGADKDLQIKYAGLIAGLDNATKNYGGMLNGFAKGDMLERKRKLEAKLQAWIEGDEERSERYLSALEDLRAVAAESNGLRERALFYEYLARRGTLLQTARTLYRLAREKQKPDMDREPGYQERDFRRLEERMVRISRSYAPEVDRVFYRHFLLSYAATPADQHVEIFDNWFGIDGNQVDEAALDAKLDKMYAASGLGDEATRLAWMKKAPADFEASDDPFIQLAVKMFDSDMKIEEQRKDLQGRFDEVRPRYMEALIAFLGSHGKAVYPDANSTLRVTYGTVQGYRPRDGVFYTPFTVLDGIADKHTGEMPFDAPKEQLEAIHQKRAGRWADETLGAVPVNFLTDVDTTGGNSGSATLGSRGELIGLVFDGNWESIISDWDFLPKVTRSIHVDIRYVLWVMEELDGAGYLLEEMGVAQPAA